MKKQKKNKLMNRIHTKSISILVFDFNEFFSFVFLSISFDYYSLFLGILDEKREKKVIISPFSLTVFFLDWVGWLVIFTMIGFKTDKQEITPYSIYAFFCLLLVDSMNVLI